MKENKWWDQRRQNLRKQLRSDSQRISSQIMFDQGRTDAGETNALALALEAMMTEAFDVEYPESIALRICPIDDTAAPGADTVAYRQGNTYGEAAVISSHADDLPLIERSMKKFTQRVIPFGAAYEISQHELQGAVMQGISIDADKARDVRIAHDRFLDTLAFSGNTEYGIKGVANQASIPLVTAITGTWSGATAAQILDDVRKLLDSIHVATKQLLQADALYCSPEQYGYLGKPWSTSSDKSIREWLLASRPELKEIAPWWRLATADAAGTGPRLLAMCRRPDVFRLRITQPFTQAAAQERNLAYVVNCHMRSPGVIMSKPLGLAHMDGC